MKKIIIFLLTIFLALAALTGCSYAPETERTDNAAVQIDAHDISKDALKTAEQIIEKDGVYTTPALVAAYLHTFNRLPSNYITKKEAQQLGWDSKSGNLAEVAKGKSIGGDHFGNYENKLPKGSYRECDVNYSGGRRNAERLIYDADGDIYYTADHYNSFEQLY